MPRCRQGFDVQRVGLTGMPTRTQQCDLRLCAYASHGDTRRAAVPVEPGGVLLQAVQAFDSAAPADPVFVLSDLDIGMNDWIVPGVASGTTPTGPTAAKMLSKKRSRAVPNSTANLDRERRRHPVRTLPE